MTRRNIATILCLVAAASLVLVAGCKKTKKSDTDKSGGATTAPMKGMTAPPMADMGPAAPMKGMQGGMAVAKAPVKALGKGRVGALPIPGNYPMVTIYLKAARTTALFKKFETKLKGLLNGALAKQKMLNSLVTKCKLDVFGNVDSVSLSRSPTSKDPDNTVIIINGTFDAPKLLACMSTEMKAAKIEHKDLTIGGKKGYEIKMKDGKSATALALGPKSFAMIGKTLMPVAKSVLEGKLQSIEDTAMYKGCAKGIKAKPATVLAIMVPTVPASLLANIKFPVAKKIRALKATLGLPKGGLELKAGVDLGDAKTAKMAAKTVPALLGIVKAKLGALGAKLLQNLKVVDEKTWMKVDLTLDKATFDQLQGFATKMLGSMLGGGMAPKAKPATPGMAPTKGGKK